MKRHATSLVFLLAIVVMGVWLWLDRDRVTEGERHRRENNVFSAWRRDELSRIEIVHEGETILLERNAKTESSWRLLSPRQERADHAAVERLVTTLEFASVVRKSAADALGEPRAHGSITMGNLVFAFVLGGASPRPEGSGYLSVDGAPPFVVSKELADALLAPSETYRDRTVIPYLSLELARFEIAPGFVLERADERSFKVGGSGLYASRSAVDKVWAGLSEMRAEAFPKEADADALTAHPRFVIRMTPKGTKPPGELVVGEACPGHPDDVVVLRRLPTRVAACAPRGAIDGLAAVTPDSLVDRRPFSFRPDEIEELRLEALPPAPPAPAALEIARRGTGFHQREPEDRELTAGEADAASELLGRIDLAAGDRVAPNLEPFHAVARARVRSGAFEEVVEVGEQSLHRLRDNALLTVTAEVARRLTPRKTSFRPRELLHETRRVHGLHLRCGTAQDLVDEGAGLKLKDPPGYETDGSVTQLVDGLLKGKVLAWVADRDDGSFGIDVDHGCRVVIMYEDGNAPTTIALGREGEGGVYGVVDGSREVFSASLSLKTQMSRIYVDRSALRVEPGRIESVKVVSARSRIASDPSTLRSAVGAMFAERVVALGTTDVGPVDVELLVAREGGAPKRIVCGPSSGGHRLCATPDVKAVFEVRPKLEVSPEPVVEPQPSAGAEVPRKVP